jgi:hypothetical protein
MNPAARGPTIPAVSGGLAPPAPPQYAEFETSKSGSANHEDSLPQMPSWESSNSKKVMLEDGAAVEMKDLKKPDTNAQNVPLMTGTTATPGPASPSPDSRTPYGAASSQGSSSGYFPPGTTASDPYTQRSAAYNQTGGGYAQPAPVGGMDQAYGMAGAAVGVGRQSPRAYNDNVLGQSRGFPPPARQGSFDNYNMAQRQGSYDTSRYGPAGDQGYGAGPRRSPRDVQGGFAQDGMRRSPGPQSEYGNYAQDNMRRSPAPVGDYDPYDSRPYGTPQRQYSSDSTRPLRQPPQRQYSHDMAPSSPPQNGGGFDFNSGYSRPAPAGVSAGNYSRRPSATQSPPPLQQQTPAPAAYPGYRAYQPATQQQDGWNGV